MKQTVNTAVLYIQAFILFMVPDTFSTHVSKALQNISTSSPGVWAETDEGKLEFVVGSYRHILIKVSSLDALRDH